MVADCNVDSQIDVAAHDDWSSRRLTRASHEGPGGEGRRRGRYGRDHPAGKLRSPMSVARRLVGDLAKGKRDVVRRLPAIRRVLLQATAHQTVESGGRSWSP